MIQDLQSLFTRELIALKKELNSYNDQENVWKTANDIKNNAGNLALHLIGNLNHFIGNVLCGINYTRDRDFEFNGKHVPLEELNKMIDSTIEMIEKEFINLDPKELNKTFPIPIFKTEHTTSFMLLHFLSHFNYHLGQINYHRRLIDA